MRYRLRTLLIVMAALGVWLGLRVNVSRRQRAAVAAIQRLGGTVYFEHQMKHDSRGRLVAIPNAPLPHPGWLRPVAERVFPSGVASVRLRDTPATDRDLELLKSLPRVRYLDLANTNISDEGLVVVGRLRRLQSLTVLGPSIGDRGVEHLRGLRLEQLSLWKTKVTDAGVRHLRGMTSLRSLILDETCITDAALEDVGQLVNLDEWLGLTHNDLSDAGLPNLKNLKKLRNLNLIGTKVSSDGLSRLRATLPETNVSPY